ncbi:MAG: hypothetical protein H0U62_07930 [Actinobacteria bacterium]|nr:hypothetical protein [Actinomycetota bacterium]
MHTETSVPVVGVAVVLRAGSTVDDWAGEVAEVLMGEVDGSVVLPQAAHASIAPQAQASRPGPRGRGRGRPLIVGTLRAGGPSRGQQWRSVRWS